MFASGCTTGLKALRYERIDASILLKTTTRRGFSSIAACKAQLLQTSTFFNIQSRQRLGSTFNNLPGLTRSSLKTHEHNAGFTARFVHRKPRASPQVRRIIRERTSGESDSVGNDSSGNNHEAPDETPRRPDLRNESDKQQFLEYQSAEGETWEKADTANKAFKIAIITINVVIFGCFAFSPAFKPYIGDFISKHPELANAPDRAVCNIYLTGLTTTSFYGLWNMTRYKDSNDNTRWNLKQWIVPAFSHKDLLHVACNMIAFNALISTLTPLYKPSILFPIYIIGGVGALALSSLATQLTNPVASWDPQKLHAKFQEYGKKQMQSKRGGPPLTPEEKKEFQHIQRYTTPALGASTSLSAYLAITAFAVPWARFSVMFVPYGFSAKQILAGLAVFDIGGCFIDYGLNFGHLEHLGGYAAGLLMWFLWLRKRQPADFKRVDRLLNNYRKRVYT